MYVKTRGHSTNLSRSHHFCSELPVANINYSYVLKETVIRVTKMFDALEFHSTLPLKLGTSVPSLGLLISFQDKPGLRHYPHLQKNREDEVGSPRSTDRIKT